MSQNTVMLCRFVNEGEVDLLDVAESSGSLANLVAPSRGASAKSKSTSQDLPKVAKKAPKAAADRKTTPKKTKEEGMAIPSHPPYIDMVKTAVVALKSRKGSSKAKITNFIAQQYKLSNNRAAINKCVRGALQKAVETKVLSNQGGMSGYYTVYKAPVPEKAAKVTPKKATKMTAKSPKKTTTSKSPKTTTSKSPKKTTPKKQTAAAKKSPSKSKSTKKVAEKATKSPKGSATKAPKPKVAKGKVGRPRLH